MEQAQPNPTPPPPPQPGPGAPPVTGRRLRRLPARLWRVAGTLALLWLVLQHLVLPPVIHRVARRALVGVGLTGLQFTVRGVGLTRTELADLRFAGDQGDANSSIQAIAVEYTPWTLLHGRVRAIEITGAQVDLVWREGGLEVPGLRLAPAAASPTTRPAGAGVPALPLERVQLRGSVLNLAWEGGSVSVPVSGSITQTRQNLNLDVTATVQNAPLHLVATAGRSDGSVAATVSCRQAQTAALLALLPPSLLEQWPVLLAGPVSGTANFRQTAGGRSLSVELVGRGLRARGEAAGDRYAVTGLDFTVAAALDGSFDLADLKLDVACPSLNYGPYALANTRLSARQQGTELVLAGTSAGHGVTSLRWGANIAGLLPWRMVKADTPLRIRGQLEFQGRPPEPVLALARARGIDLATLGDVGLTSRLEYQRSSGSWSATLPEMELRAGPGTVALPGLLVPGVAARLSLRGEAGPFGVAVSVQPGSSVELANVLGSGVRLVPDADGPLLCLRVVDAPVEVSLAVATAGWELRAPAVELQGTPTAVIVSSGMQARGVVPGGRFSVDGSPARITLTPLDPRVLRVATIEVIEGKLDLAIEDLRLGLPRPLVWSPLHGLEASLTAQAEPPVRLRWGDLVGTARLAQVQARWRAPVDAAPEVSGRIDLDRAAVRDDVNAWAVRQGRISLPWAINAPAPAAGPVELAGLTFGGLELPDVQGTAVLVDQRLEFQGHAPVLPEAPGRLEASVDWSQAATDVRAELHVPRFTLANPAALARRVPALAGYKLGGDLALFAAVRLLGDQMTSEAALELRDVNFAGQTFTAGPPAEGWSLAGITGTFFVDSLFPLHTRAGQKLTIRSASLGSMELTDGRCAFRIDSPDLIIIDEASFAFAGGRLFSNSVELDRRQARLSATVTADRLQLAPLVPLLYAGATGTGGLYGRLPVEVRWPQGQPGVAATTRWGQPQVSFGEGFVYATPEGGRLRLADSAQFIDQYIAGADPRLRPGGALEDVRRRLVAALTDLEYNTLRVDFTRQQADRLSARVFVAGQGANDGPAVGGLTVNIHGFDEALRVYLGLLNAPGALENP
jgi:hypothetical protein